MTIPIKLFILAVVSLGLLLVTTKPEQLPSIALILPFLLIFVIAFVGIKLLFRGNTARRSSSAFLIAGLLVVFLALQSIGQLTSRDVIMLLILFMVTYFYMYRRASKMN